MRNIEIPRLKFTNWSSWENRSIIPDTEFPGVYLIAITSEDIEGTCPNWRDVVYVGMSNSKKGLQSRWRQFHRSICGSRGHSGGRSVFNEFGDYDSWRTNLYVSCMAVRCNTSDPSSDDYLKMGLVAFLEYEAFALYSAEIGGHPRFNKK